MRRHRRAERTRPRRSGTEPSPPSRRRLQRASAAAAARPVLAQYEDGKGRTSTSNSAIGNDIWDLRTNGEPFITYDTTGGFFVTDRFARATSSATIPGTPPSAKMRAPMDGTTNVARHFCLQSQMFWCGRNGGRGGTLGPGYRRWFFTINWDGPVSQFRSSQERVYIKRGTRPSTSRSTRTRSAT